MFSLLPNISKADLDAAAAITTVLAPVANWVLHALWRSLVQQRRTEAIAGIDICLERLQRAQGVDQKNWAVPYEQAVKEDLARWTTQLQKALEAKDHSSKRWPPRWFHLPSTMAGSISLLFAIITGIAAVFSTALAGVVVFNDQTREDTPWVLALGIMFGLLTWYFGAATWRLEQPRTPVVSQGTRFYSWAVRLLDFVGLPLNDFSKFFRRLLAIASILLALSIALRGQLLPPGLTFHGWQRPTAAIVLGLIATVLFADSMPGTEQ